MKLGELVQAIVIAKSQERDMVTLVVAKGPKWWQRGTHIRSALGLGRVVGTRERKDGKPGIEVIAAFSVKQLEAFIDRWADEHPDVPL